MHEIFDIANLKFCSSFRYFKNDKSTSRANTPERNPAEHRDFSKILLSGPHPTPRAEGAGISPYKWKTPRRKPLLNPWHLDKRDCKLILTIHSSVTSRLNQLVVLCEISSSKNLLTIRLRYILIKLFICSIANFYYSIGKVTTISIPK